jgi:hypothetical protein
MKKALCVGLAMAFAPIAAQGQLVANVNATATILATVNVGTPTDLDFGGLTPGTGIAVPVGGVVPGGTTRGEFAITHDSDVLVDIAVVPTQLTGPLTTIDNVLFQCGYSATPGGAATSGDCDALGNAGITAVGTSETTYVQIGGTVNAADTSVPPGIYTTTLVFTITPVL